MSADPVREAAQALLDQWDAPGWVLNGGHIGNYFGALRTALAAPEGPAPTRTTERHIALREGHFNAVEDAYWAPRPVEDGVMQRRAFEQGFIRGFDAAEKAYPEAPPLAEARQPSESEVLAEIKRQRDEFEASGVIGQRIMQLRREDSKRPIDYNARYGAFCHALRTHAGDADGYEFGLARVKFNGGKPAEVLWATQAEIDEAVARAALASPAVAAQPHLDHQVGAPVTPLPLESAGGAPSATASREHEASEHCWCEPEVDYVDPNTGAKVFVHKQTQ